MNVSLGVRSSVVRSRFDAEEILAAIDRSNEMFLFEAQTAHTRAEHEHIIEFWLHAASVIADTISGPWAEHVLEQMFLRMKGPLERVFAGAGAWGAPPTTSDKKNRYRSELRRIFRHAYMKLTTAGYSRSPEFGQYLHGLYANTDIPYPMPARIFPTRW